jgi:hypothetical protein
MTRWMDGWMTRQMKWCFTTSFTTCNFILCHHKMSPN